MLLNKWQKPIFLTHEADRVAILQQIHLKQLQSDISNAIGKISKVGNNRVIIN
jgi:hypothetical protein